MVEMNNLDEFTEYKIDDSIKNYPTKKCADCGEIYPATKIYFPVCYHSSTTNKSRVFYVCKKCKTKGAELIKNWKVNNPYITNMITRRAIPEYDFKIF